MKRLHLTRVVAAPLVAALFLSAGAAIQGQTAPQQKTAKSKAAKALVDLNTATAEELEENLPRVGPATAKKIIDGRPYASVDDLSKIGIPERVIDAIRAHVKVEAPVAAKGKTKAAAAKASAAEEPTGGKVNINTADLAALEALPGIGATIAKEIIAGRPWKSVEDLGSIRGLGKARLDALRSLVSVGPATHAAAPAAAKKAAARIAAKVMSKLESASGKKVDLNTASKEELDALPGIGPVKAQAIIEGRPFKTIEDVMKVRGIKDGEFAKIKDLITVK